MDAATPVFALPFISADIPGCAAATGVSETTIREAVAAKSLVVHYAGRRAGKPVIDAVELFAWVRSLPTERGAS